MWRPGFASEEIVHARARSASAAASASTRAYHRGTPRAARPGAGARPRRRLRGHRLSRRRRPMRAQTLRYLREREQVNGVYREALVPVTLMSGERPEVLALTFIVERAHPSYAGRLPLAEQAHLIRGAAGRSGNNIDYLVEHAGASRSARHPRARAGAAADAGRHARGARRRATACAGERGGDGAGVREASGAGAGGSRPRMRGASAIARC